MSSRSSLNHVYRTVWNQSLGAMVAVAEVATSGGRSSGAAASALKVNTSFGIKALAASLAIAWGAVPLHAFANPTGGVVVAGQASIVSTGNKLLVTTQNAAGANHSAINWESFSIPSGSTTYFQQPSASSTSINRVVTNTPSQLFGTLGSNGNLVLVNQAGITVGAGAVVDTAGFTASSLQMTDADALSGRMRFGEELGASSGKVSATGSILARSGDVVLIGSNVEAGKDALVQAPNGSTILVAGSTVSISSRGLDGINFDVQAGANSAVNLGTLKGDAVGIFAGTLKHSGQIQAQAAKIEGGKVVLKAIDLAEVSGGVKSSAGVGLGGSVHVTADKVWLKDSAALDASGQKGGGEILIGGGWQGGDARISNSHVSLVSKGASINVDAIDSGNAGTAVVWAEGATRFEGQIQAKGGVSGGDGGKVEVSGKGYLDFKGHVNLSAPRGNAGTLLLDPLSLYIVSSGQVDENGDGITGDDLASLTNTVPGSVNSSITSGAVEAQLNSGNVVLQAPGDVNVNAPISYTGSSNRSLTIQSTSLGSISGSGAIAAIGAGKLNLTLSAASGSVTTGDIVSNGGNVNISSTSSTNINGNLNAGSGNVTISASGYGGSVYQSAGTAITASSLTVSSLEGITLSEAGNSVAGSISLQTNSDTSFSGGAISFKNSASSSTVTKAIAINAGSVTIETTGTLTVIGADGIKSTNDSVSLTANGGMTLSAKVETPYSLSLTTIDTAITQTGSNISADGVTINSGTGNVSLTSATNDFYSLSITNAGTVDIKEANSIRLNSISSANFKLSAGSVNLGYSPTIATTSGGIEITATTGDITAAEGVSFSATGATSTDGRIKLQAEVGLMLQNSFGTPNLSANASGDAIILVGKGAGSEIADASLSTPNGRWLAYLQDPGGKSLPSNTTFKQYNTAPGGTALGSGSGVMFNNTTPARLTAGPLTGSVSKVYDGGTSIGLSGVSFGTATGRLGTDNITSATISGGTGTLSDPNVGTAKSVTASGMTVSGVTFLLGETTIPVYGYQVNSLSANIGEVTPASAVISLAGTRVYDGTPVVNAGIFSLSGLVGSETLTLTGSGTVGDKNVGVNKPVTLGSLALGNGSGLATNYTLTGGTAVATITPLVISSVTGVTASNKVYDGNTAATISISNAILSGKVGADVVSLSGGVGNFQDKNVGLGKTVNVSGLTLVGSDAANYSLASSNTTANASIVAKILTLGPIAALNKVYDGTTAVTLSGGTLSGAIAGDSVTLSTPTGAFVDKNVGVGKQVTVSGLSLSGTDSSNYSLLSSTVSLAADITAKTLIAGAFSALNKTYDGTTVASVSGGTLSGALSGDSVSLGAVSGNFIDKNAGTGKTVNIAGLTLSGADARNYALSSTTATASANIAPKVLTTGGYQVTSKVYDGNRSAAVTGGVLSGALAGDSVSLTSVVASFSDKNAGLAKPVTIAGGLLSGADAGNYSLSSSGSTATADIVPRPVTVGGLSANNKVYDGTTLAVVSGGVVTGAVAGDTVSVNVGASAFADKNVGTGKLISVSGVALAGADALNYSLASTSTSLTANIAARPVTVGSISVSGKTYDGTTAAQVSGGSLLGAVSGDAVSIGALSGSFLDKNVGTNKPVVLSGLVLNGGDASNYSLNPGSVSAVASIAPRVVSVSALTAGDKVYDGTTSATLLGGVLSGAVAGDNVALAPVSGNFLDKNVGAAKPVAVSGLSLTGGDAGNYTLGLVGVNASASITPKPLVVSGITALNKPYDGKTDATIDTSKAVLSGLVAGDLVTTTEMKAAFADKNAGTAKKVLLTGLGLTGADARNYTFSGDSVTTADITVRESSNWLGAAGDLWSDPKNWDVVPEGANVRSVVFPANTSRVTLNAGAGSVSLQSFSLGGSLVVEGGSLQVAGGITTAGYAQSGGAVSTPGAFRVTGNFDQTLGNLNAASVEVTRVSGDIVVGNITAPTVTLTAQSGAIRQSGAIQQAALTTRSTAGTLLLSTGNRLSSFSAANTGTGDIELVNTGVLTTSGITNTGGNIKITNTGGISSLDEGLISASSPGAKVSLTANSPLSIGASGIVAGGDIALVATNLTSAGNITLNGPIESKAGAVALTAANNLTQNSSVLAPLGVSAAAGGTLTLGPTATSGYQPVSYQVNSLPVAPPRSPASSNSATDLVVALMTTATDPVVDRSVTPLESLITKDKDRDRDSSKALIVSEGQVCRP